LWPDHGYQDGIGQRRVRRERNGRLANEERGDYRRY
jgi:hypothetical protein